MADFTQYDIKPQAFINYLRYHGEHFNKKLCKFACSHFPEIKYTKAKLEELLNKYDIKLEHCLLYDHVYGANLLYSLFFNSSIQDEKQLLLVVKDMFDREHEIVFNHWYADMAKLGIAIDWEDMI